MPETTRMRLGSADIGIRPPAAEQGLQFLAVGTAENPDRWEIDRHPATDERNDAGHAFGDRTVEPAAEHRPDSIERGHHQGAGQKLADNPAGKPALDPEMTAAVEDDVE